MIIFDKEPSCFTSQYVVRRLTSGCSVWSTLCWGCSILRICNVQLITEETPSWKVKPLRLVPNLSPNMNKVCTDLICFVIHSSICPLSSLFDTGLYSVTAKVRFIFNTRELAVWQPDSSKQWTESRQTINSFHYNFTFGYNLALLHAICISEY